MNISNMFRSSVTIFSEFSTDESFRKHGKILEKLNQRQQQQNSEFRLGRHSETADFI